jgi:hypothetical protein
VGLLAVQLLLIAGLLYQRRARQRAEMDSRRNLALAADASRRQTMSALTGSIAHELSQPLNAILHNAQAGEMLVSSNRATPEVLREVLSDIRTAMRASQIVERHRTVPGPAAGHEAHRYPCRRARPWRWWRDAKEAGPVGVTCRQSRSSRRSGAPAGARQSHVERHGPMAGVPPDRRRLKVHNEVTRCVNVRWDAGWATVRRQLLSHSSRRADGIGIRPAIARTIVETIRQDDTSSSPGGATFTVTLPRDGRLHP